MEMSGKRRLAVPRRLAWEKLNDPVIIRAAIPGCEAMERTDEGFALVMRASLGPVNAKFKGRLWLENVVVYERYTLCFTGEGIAAGFAKGAANVVLADEGEATILDYQVSATIGGKLAQLGSRLVDPAARKLADSFFAEFEKAIAGG